MEIGSHDRRIFSFAYNQEAPRVDCLWYYSSPNIKEAGLSSQGRLSGIGGWVGDSLGGDSLGQFIWPEKTTRKDIAIVVSSD